MEIDNHRPVLLRHALGIMKNRDDAEDAVGEAVYFALTHQSDYDPATGDGGLRAWLLAIVQQTCRAQRRRSSREIARSVDGVNLEEAAAVEEALEEAVIRRLDEKARREQLHEAIAAAGVSEREQQILSARVAGQSYRDIAAWSGESVGNCRIIAYRAVRKVKESVASGRD